MGKRRNDRSAHSIRASSSWFRLEDIGGASLRCSLASPPLSLLTSDARSLVLYMSAQPILVLSSSIPFSSLPALPTFFLGGLFRADFGRFIVKSKSFDWSLSSSQLPVPLLIAASFIQSEFNGKKNIVWVPTQLCWVNIM
ncbi:unnamed protein product [Bursaphelenchus xylophilus]|uniref:(pine wood nematode) hypothetical protein n=1 Tax=Bursaphelenchus xylophilus TaxID=6326 RepID=A0A1I7SC21_BURXY|nr:unnamed protein product [Bursaphelenchus xylophilus]CAG9086421.1 unnamed protein product [Bursaphelenchus xylophilus]